MFTDIDVIPDFAPPEPVEIDVSRRDLRPLNPRKSLNLPIRLDPSTNATPSFQFDRRDLSLVLVI
jgi:hypothetical protein